MIGDMEANPGPPPARSTRQTTLSTSGELLDWQKEFDELRGEFSALRQENRQLKNRVEFLESHNKRNNLSLYGIEEEDDEYC